MVGQTFYSCFVPEGTKRVLSIAACPTLLDKFDDDIVRISCQDNSDGKFCKIRVHPVFCDPEKPEKGLRYHAVTLEELKVAEDTSIVYLPMPAGFV